MLVEQVVGQEVYLKKQVIGNGGFARCHLMVNAKTGQKVAGKVIRRKQLRERGARQKLMLEIDIHQETDHPNIVKIIQVFDYEGQMYIVLELCQNNSMKEFLKSRIRITQFESKCYMKQLVDGLEYLHGKGIVHRDMKLGNVFLNSKMQVKIGDFGLSAKLQHPRERRFTTCGTPNYIAPQILAQTGHGFQVDIWALGIILYALLIGKPPFEANTVEQTYRRIKHGNFEFPKQIPISAQAKHIIRGMLDSNPKTRLGLSQIKAHEFMTTGKVPLLMPPYTISIPPQSSYLKQWVGDKPVKLSIYPRRVSQSGMEDISCGGTRLGKQKLNRVLSCDKNMFKMASFDTHRSHSKSELNRGLILNTKMRNNLKEETCPYKFEKHQQDVNEVICYYDVSTKYGIGYLLSNGSCGVSFNDETSLTETSQGLLYYDKKQVRKVEAGKVEKKMAILKLCQQKLKVFSQKNILISFDSEVVVKKFTKGRDLVVLKLTNGLLQFFWGPDSIALRGYKWVRWRIGREEGQGPLAGRQYPAHIEARVAKVRDFLRKESQRSQRRKG